MVKVNSAPVSTSSTPAFSLPIGTIVLFSGDDISKEWLFCNGTAISRASFSALFQVIGTLYGPGDHIRTFNLPDFRGRFPLGIDSSKNQQSGIVQGGAVDATITQAELPPHVHGSGSLISSSAGDHTHAYDDPGHNHGGKTGLAVFGSGGNGMQKSGYGADFNSHSHTIDRDYARITIKTAGAHVHSMRGETALAGSGQAFSIMNPYQTINYIIYVGPQSLGPIGKTDATVTLPHRFLIYFSSLFILYMKC